MTHDFREVPVARSLLRRIIGLIGAREASLLIPNCAAVHTWFMRRPIDIVFIDQRQVVVSVRAGASPWRVVAGPADAVAILELPAGRAREVGLTPGDTVLVDPSGWGSPRLR